MRRFTTTLAIAATLFASSTAFAQSDAQSGSDTDWPTRPINVIIGASPGGDTDFNARTFAQYFEQVTGQSMVVTNTPGGGATIATSAVRDADPDGYTILFGHTGHLIVAEVSGLADYGLDAFEICCVPAVDQGAVIVTSSASGIESVEDLVSQTKESPDSVIYGTELGGYSHLQGLMLQNQTEAQMRLVDTGSAAEKIAALLGGRIQVAGIAYGAVQDYVEGGQMNVIGQPNDARNPLIGDIPTFAEQDIDFVMTNPYIIAFPKGTDQAIVDKMGEIAEEISEIPEYAEALEQGFKQPVSFMPRDEAVTRLNEIRDRYMDYRDELQASR
ncbi:tripartite tricarboxylate transporter substrate binding protein [Fulvimarina sp. 2208YS6-2-32]|uniref:Tripartite tricarboxylate transporter substrate binding protein n=1 Tax=Fulvimarina uroteuthidis TaxID=3098149 RepID=A0ABU5HYK2_9HYPH|nr:tripartite tricarboxylate transporter substrate binding protein [Fulvimarina sp. 2208YS6-2-32]MDY8108140.1 tripartite tricarboxylate transporter substrate binding protein [Fulvimarina sp. 2208YS6-2-32]